MERILGMVAGEWVKDNPDAVAEWTKGVEEVDGVEVELVSTQWDSELSSTHAVAEVMKQKGYDITIS
ncbi:hypothetical protein [Virgibacillus sp. L01]|uniref:hypothetical protein n=1 Tax=Virgibacillus sp. L01 TaxID=3457429 RepID=UPI003FD2BC16